MPYATNRDVRIHYRSVGEGPALVLQHGFFWSIEGWFRVGYVDALKSNYRLILIDARGHGRSDKPHTSDAYSLSLHVGDIVAVLDALDISKTHYWGFSMGGWFGFGMAKYAPERIESLIIGGAAPYGRKLPAANRPDGTDPEAFIDAFMTRAGLDRSAFTSAEDAEFLDNDFQALAACMQDRPSLEDVLPTISKPCLLYVGENDGILPKVEACSEHIPNGSLVTFPGINHPAAFYRADLVLPHVSRFLETNLKR